MKKVLLLAGATALFMMTSCSSSDNSDNNSNSGSVLVKKTIETDESGDQYISNYNYDGNKLTTVTHNDGTKEVVTYTGDKISKIEYFEGTTLYQEDDYAYNTSGQLATLTMLFFDEDWGDRTVFSYNSDDTIDVQNYIGDTESQTQLDQTGVITMHNGNVVSFVADGYTTTYTFDDKNSPFKNVTGFAVTNIAYQEGGVNNILTYHDSFDNSQTTYTYNSQNYPATSVETDDDGDVYSIEYTYQ